VRLNAVSLAFTIGAVIFLMLAIGTFAAIALGVISPLN
jgi:hypothetical protein